MKNRRLLYYGLNAAGLIIGFGIVGAIYFYVREDLNKFFIGLAIALIGLIFFVVAYCKYNFADRELKHRWISYVVLKRPDSIDFADELEKTKSKFDSDNDPQKNRIAKPNVGGVKHLLDFNVLQSGEMCYGCVVEANTRLFTPSKFVNQVLPAVILYSFDEHFDKNPIELKEISKIFFNQEKDNILKNETRMFTNFKISNELTSGKEVFATVVLVYRRHLPWGGFPSSHLIIPIIANPNQSTSAFIVDSKYWSDNLVAQYLQEIMPASPQLDDKPMSNEKINEIFEI